MATANSTTSITRNRNSTTGAQGASRPKQDISHINPMAQVMPADTMVSVSSVLSFVSSALTAMMEQDASVYDVSNENFGDGLKVILDTCQAALDSHATTEGGAQ